MTGAVTPDGCPVEVYLRLPPRGEAELVHSAVTPDADVLDLGAGVGRIAHRLVLLGHDVVAVDESAEMLAHVRGAQVVRCRIENLVVGRRFGAVLLASHLVNGSDPVTLLTVAAAHLAPGGALVAEVHPDAWFDTVDDTASGSLGDVGVQLRDVRRAPGRVDAVVRYTVGAVRWDQPFTAHRRTEADLASLLDQVGLRWDRWLDPARSWFRALPASPRD